MKNQKRALRRHHRERMLNKRRRQINEFWVDYTDPYRDQEWPEMAARYRLQTPHACSNPICCGNPRRTHKREVLTLQEQRNLLSFDEQIGDYCYGDSLVED